MTLESKDAEAINAAFERCQKNLKLKENIDPFAVFADLDDEAQIVDEDDID